jgi:hypothetical protein
MNPLVISGLFTAAQSLIERFFPDPEKKAAAQIELLKMQQTGELAELASITDLAKLQIQVNIEEAKSTNWFVAGGRPAVMWICAAAFGYTYVILPFLQFILFAFGSAEMVKQLALLPVLDIGAMMPVFVRDAWTGWIKDV